MSLSGPANAQYDYNQIINEVAQKAVELGSKTTNWDWEASGHGGYILMKNKDLNEDGFQDLIVKSTVLGEGFGWDVYYGKSNKKYNPAKKAGGLPQSILHSKGVINEDGSISYFFDSRQGSYEAYLTEYQFTKNAFKKSDFMVDPSTIYQNEETPEWVKKELEGKLDKYKLINWSDFQEASKSRSSNGLPETLIVQGVLLSGWLSGGAVKWEQLDLLKSSTANGYLRFEGDKSKINETFSSSSALNLLSGKKNQPEERNKQKRNNIISSHRNLPSANHLQSERKESESEKKASNLPWIIAGVLLAGILALLFKTFKGKSTS